MTRIAGERIRDLFALAEVESARRTGSYSDRYVDLARRIGTRYNVRLPPGFSDLYCRGCSTYWVEGRTVRTRIRAGRRVRTCLRCGRVRRFPIPREPRAAGSVEPARRETESPESLALVEDLGEPEDAGGESDLGDE